MLEKGAGALRAVGQGMTLNLADEAGSAMGAGWDMLTDDNDTSFSDRYDANMESSKQQRASYAKAMPKTALASEIGGGFLTGGVGGAKVLGTQAIKNAPKLVKALAGVGVGAGEGAVAGFGSGGTMDERISGAGTGALIGAAIPAAISGASSATRGISNKLKLDKPLEVLEDGTQMGLALADKDGWRGSFYRNVVGPAFGGGKVIDDAKPFVQRADDAVTEQLGKVADVTENVRLDTLASNQAATAASVQSALDSKNAITNATQAAKDAAKTEMADIDTAFRSNVQGQSQPINMSAKEAAKLAGANTQQATKIIGDEWVKNGFKTVTQKGRKFAPPDTKKMNGSIRRVFNNDPALRREAKGYADDFMEMFEELPRYADGTVSGANLMEFRNGYARSANSATDPLQRKIMGSYKEKIDEIIRGGLKGSELEDYAADKNAWDMFSNMRKSTGKAANRKGGDYTADDWLSSTSNSRLANESGPEQLMAQDVQKQLKAVNEKMGLDIKGLSERTDAVNNKALAKEALAQAKEQARQSGVEKISQANQGLTKSKDALADIKKSAPSEKSGLATRLIATGMLGGGGLVGGPLGTAASGSMVARMLSRDLTQKILSGEPLEKALNKYSPAIRKQFKGMSVADILRQGTAAGAVQSQIE
jgi:hypothetical protein